MERLTPKQEEVMRLMAKGMTNGQIAERMGVSLSGAKWHVSEVLGKLGVATREEAVMLWREENSVGSRMRAFLGAVFGPKVVVGAAALGGMAGVFVVATLVVGGGGDDGSGEPQVNEDAAGGSSPLIYAGACDEWDTTYDGVPLCGPMAPDEVRYTVEVEGAKVTVRGLAGSEAEYVELLLANGGAVLTNVNLERDRFAFETADEGGFFLYDGTFASPPVGLRFTTEEQGIALLDGRDIGVVAEVDFGDRFSGKSWPTPTPMDVADFGDYELSLNGACISVRFERWGTVGQPDPCYDPSDPFLRGGGSYEDDGYFSRGVMSTEFQRMILGFDDGSLVEADILELSGADGAAFHGYVFASSNPFPNSQTTVKADGTTDARRNMPPTRRRDWFLYDGFPPPAMLAFADGEVSLVANEHDCLSWTLPGGGESLTCHDPHRLRNVEEFPIVRVIGNSSDVSRLSAVVVTNADVAAVEVVDAEGNVYREEAQTIPSSPHGLKFVYFDRAVAASAEDLRAIGADGAVLEVKEDVM